MSDLAQYKMPIIQDVNDIPSVPEDPTHPNASLFCKQYNDLIDSIDSMSCQQPSNTVALVAYWVDGVGGNDVNNGTEISPFLTIERALLEIKSWIHTTFAEIIIYIKGSFENVCIDISCIFPDLYSQNNSYWANGFALRICKWESELNKPEITINDRTPLVISNNKFKLDLLFEEIKFSLNDVLLIQNNNDIKIYFDYCDFITENKSTIIVNSVVYFYGCFFKSNTLSFTSIKATDGASVKIDDCDIYNYNFMIEAIESTIYNTYDSNAYTDENRGFLGQPRYYLFASSAYIDYDALQDQYFALRAGATVYSFEGIMIGNNNYFLGNPTDFAVNKKTNYNFDGIFTAQELFKIQPSDANGTGKISIINGDLDITNVNKGVIIDTKKVLGARQPSIPDAVIGTEVATINSILTALRTHGLIEP